MNALSKRLSVLTAILVFAFALLSFVPIGPTASALKVCSDGTTVEDGAECAKPNDVPGCLFGEGCAFSNLTNAALFVIGAISVLMLIYGGIRYTISGGNEKDVVAAKNTILYAIVGVVVALLAYAIVNFVLGVFV